MRDALLTGNLHMVRLGNQVNHDLAIGAGDLSADVMPMCLGPRTVEVRDFAAPVLHDANTVVDVLKLTQLRVVLERADSKRSLGDEILAHIEQREIDVVDAAVDEDTAVARGVAHEEPRIVEEVAGLRADEEWRSNCAVVAGYLRFGGTVRCIKATRVARHHF